MNDLEVFDTRNSIQESALNCLIALISSSLVLSGGAKYAPLSGLTYMLTGVLLATNGTIMGRQRSRMLKLYADPDKAQEVEL